ncbi:hypothetical protein EV182_002608 [Spiromyces aspiralis]|uniref:Uncharacterized protein n=1 Tax=Spiromyces aspiralis TaxID=68401 RepID=A0ACC1HRH0_9FUNG|nr:hypothetical protein EV182_002608 [Spiromyces aspiralis]
MSWKDINSGKTDMELYKEFHENFMKDEVISSVLEDKYTGEDKPLILEQIGVNLSQVGLVFDHEDHPELCAERFHAMRARQVLDKALRPLCKATDKDLEDFEVRPFCLYSIDAAKVYKQELNKLPESSVEFARLAIEHEMDCSYEDDTDYDDVEEDSESEEELENDDNMPTQTLNEEAEADKSKGKASANGKDVREEENKDQDTSSDEDEEDSDDADYEDLELPFEESECEVVNAAEVVKNLKVHEATLVEALTKETGVSIDEFKCYKFPGRYYIVTWLEGLGIFGLRLSELFELDEEGEKENETKAGASLPTKPKASHTRCDSKDLAV